MKTDKKLKSIFRAVFALEEGGGSVDVKGFDLKHAWSVLVSVEPNAEKKVKSFRCLV